MQGRGKMEKFQFKNKLILLSLIFVCSSIVAMSPEERRAIIDARKQQQEKAAPAQTPAPATKTSWFGFGSSAAPKAQEPVLLAPLKTETVTIDRVKQPQPSMITKPVKGVTIQQVATPAGNVFKTSEKVGQKAARHVQFSPTVQEREIPAKNATVGTAVVQPTAKIEAQITKMLAADKKPVPVIKIVKAEEVPAKLTEEQQKIMRTKFIDQQEAVLALGLSEVEESAAIAATLDQALLDDVEADLGEIEDEVTLDNLLAALQSKVIELSNIVASDLIGVSSSKKIDTMTSAQKAQAYQVAQKQKAAVANQTAPVVQPTVAASVAAPTIEIKAPVASTASKEDKKLSDLAPVTLSLETPKADVANLQALAKQVDIAAAQAEEATQKKLTWGQYFNPFADKQFALDSADSIVDEDKNSNLERAWKPEDGPSRLDQAWDWAKGKYNSFRTPSEYTSEQYNAAVDGYASSEAKPGMMTRASDWTKGKLGGSSLDKTFGGLNQGVSAAVSNEQQRAQDTSVMTGNAENSLNTESSAPVKPSKPQDPFQFRSDSQKKPNMQAPVAQPAVTQSLVQQTSSQPRTFRDRLKANLGIKSSSPEQQAADKLAGESFAGILEQAAADNEQMKADNALIKEVNREILRDSLSDRVSQVVDNFSDGLNIARSVPLHKNADYLEKGRKAAFDELERAEQYEILEDVEEAQRQAFKKEGDDAAARERALMAEEAKQSQSYFSRAWDFLRPSGVSTESTQSDSSSSDDYAREGDAAARREEYIEKMQDADDNYDWTTDPKLQ